MTKSERLIGRLRSEFGLDLPDDVGVQRTYAGINQRMQGAWSWFLVSGPEHPPYGRRTPFRLDGGEVGSQYPVSQLLGLPWEFDRDHYGDWHIDPVWSPPAP